MSQPIGKEMLNSLVNDPILWKWWINSYAHKIIQNSASGCPALSEPVLVDFDCKHLQVNCAVICNPHLNQLHITMVYVFEIYYQYILMWKYLLHTVRVDGFWT